MTPQAATALAIFIIATALFAAIMVMARGKRLAKEEELRHAAAARGWKFESKMGDGYRMHVWSGVTDGVAWQAESLQLESGGSKSGRRRRIGRWHGQFSPGITAPILCMGVPRGKEILGHDVVQGEGMLARMAQKAAGFAFDKAIDVYFGKSAGEEVDASAMRRADGEKIPGIIVMATNPDEGARVLSEGLSRALIDATNDRSSVLSEDDRPWLLLRPGGISLARMQKLRDLAEIDKFVHSGVALTRAFRFGRGTRI